MSELDDLPPPRSEPIATFAQPARSDASVPPPPPAAPGRLGPPPLANASIAWTVVAIAVVALAAAAGGAVWRPRGGEVDRASATVRALVGAGIGAVVAATAPFILRRRRLALPAAIITAITVLLIALGAILGSASAPTEDPESAQPNQPPPSKPDERPDEGPDGQPTGGGQPNGEGRIPFSKNASARLVDADGDGQPDRDENGELIVAFDSDGDGTFERRLVRCPGSEDRPSSSGTPSVRLDLGCDGDVDGTIPINPTMLSFLPSLDGTGEGELAPIDPDFGDGESQTEDQQNQSTDPDDETTDSGDDTDDDSGGIGSALKATLLTLLALVAIGLVAYGISALVRRRNTQPEWTTDAPTEDPADEETIDAAAVDAALEESIETLLGHPDPRLAIRAAYAVLLDALAECGFARRSFEAPDEHLTRCLTGLSVEPAPMRELLRLYAVARFSTHDVTEDDRAAAVAALRHSQELLRRRSAEIAAATAGRPEGSS